MMTATIERAIREHFPMPADIRKHASAANSDLYFGPLGVDHWREQLDDDEQPDYCYVESRGVLVDWIDECGEVWIDDDSGCVADREPEGEWHNPETGEYSDTWQDPDDGWEWLEPMPYWRVGPRDIAEAFGYADLYR